MVNISIILSMCFFCVFNFSSLLQSFGKSEKYQLYKELKNCLDVIEPVDEKPLEEVVFFLILIWNLLHSRLIVLLLFMYSYYLFILFRSAK